VRTSSHVPTAPIAAIGVLIAALAIASLARVRPPEAPPERVHATGERAPACVNINRANSEELETLPRVGPSLAARILADREAHGAFPDLDSLDRVRGIGPATLRVLRPHLCELRVSTRADALPDAGPPR
jgi:competence protein ComEA